jgi:hypothetical protein
LPGTPQPGEHETETGGGRITTAAHANAQRRASAPVTGTTRTLKRAPRLSSPR